MDNWQKAGKIASETRDYGISLFKEGETYIDIVKKIEEFIEKKGAKTAFPINISKNNLAAHYTPTPNDETKVEAGDLIKLDVGIHVDGAVGDTARTIEIKTNEYTELKKASEEALKNAIKILQAGLQVREIGKVVAETIQSYNFKPVKNLSGHGIEEWTVHAHPSIPNYDNNDKTKLEEGQVIAIEPFASNGAGFIKEGKGSSIYSIQNNKQVRDPITRKVLDYIKQEHRTLPFSKRDIVKKFPPFQTNIALNTLLNNNIIHEYAQLPEKDPQARVSQKEHTIRILDKPEVLTRERE